MTRRGGARAGGPVPVGDLLGRVTRGQLGQGMHRARAVTLWPQLAGPELSRLSRARNTHQGVLWVEAENSSLAHLLTMQRTQWVQKLQRALGDDSITDIRFVTATPQRHAPKASPPSPLPPPDPRRARELLAKASVPDGLRAAALRAAAAVDRRARWQAAQALPPCPVCGVPNPRGDAEPCPPCRINLQNPLVQRAARDLVRDPSAADRRWEEPLGEHGLNAARWLARGVLEEQLHSLARECLGQPALYRDLLRARVGVYLALRGHRVSDDDLTRDHPAARLLPPTVRTLL